ncbi:polysaccharide biosynthesis tyrosine autokinase [Nocardioides sp. AE5]|uniref:polysaccharide biosynthesis tyrosine autokinase n=1 Tax=Nocardioides sp. AE5 TaxID=2962573 RepID=UPI002881F917|nr:polysaccharide biosynthesis tyrosine autokinase [Nocardioides sp. AE5]MDT0202655.1 polysaccharide biosynthesis tyrosine autokinase [Nocardioides sp. AE5]
MELKDYLRILRRRWFTIVLLLVLTVGAAAALTLSATPQYASTARLFVSTSPADTSQAYQGNLFATQRVSSYADIVKGRQLADRVAGAMDQGFEGSDLVGKVKAVVVPETVILELTATDPNADTARDIAQTYADELSQMVAELETPEGSDTPLIKASIVDDARANYTAVSPNIPRNLGLAVVLGLLLGVGIAVVRELLDTSISSAEDIEQSTAAPVVGNIFFDAAATKKAPSVSLDQATPWAEAYRVLRTNMQFVQVDSPTKVFVLTSSLPAEGKTTTAINLAVTMAMAEQRVVLVEADLRRPLISERLGLVGAVGTTSVLVGKIGLDEALQPYEDTGLQVLTSGPIPPNPSELLQSQAMDRLLNDLRERFDVVIIDAPPLLPVTDAALIARQADGAFVVVRHGKTTKDQLAHAVERIEAVDARVLGVVINRTPQKRKGSAYGYGYGYGYGYAPDPAKLAAQEDDAVAEQIEANQAAEPGPAPTVEPAVEKAIQARAPEAPVDEEATKRPAKRGDSLAPAAAAPPAEEPDEFAWLSELREPAEETNAGLDVFSSAAPETDPLFGPSPEGDDDWRSSTAERRLAPMRGEDPGWPEFPIEESDMGVNDVDPSENGTGTTGGKGEGKRRRRRTRR